MAKVTHYYPDAMVVFVKGFRDVENVSADKLLTIQTKSIMSINLTMTVANNPSTFSLSINDVGNQFLLPDQPEQEISNLENNSDYQVRRDETTRDITSSTQPVHAYEFNGYNNGEYPWLSFEWGTLIDPSTKQRFMIYYKRDINNNIVYRWAFDENGEVIRVSDSIAESTFQDPQSNGTTFLFHIDNSSDRRFTLYKFKNQDFINKYQLDVPNPLQHGRCKIEPQDRLVIFLSKRYKEGNSGTFILNEAPKTELIRAFTGLVNTVQVSYNEGSGNTINVTGEDVTKWLHLSVVDVDPAAIMGQELDMLKYSATNSDALNWYTKIFQGLTTPEVVKLMCLGTQGYEADSRSKSEKSVLESHASIRGVGVFSAASHTNVNPETVTYDPEKDEFIVTDSTATPNSKRISTIDIRGILGNLFQKNSVHVVDPTKVNLQGDPSKIIDTYNAYNQLFNIPQKFQAEFHTRREICESAATDSNYNFYADRNGHIWFHPPRYYNGWILSQENDKLYIMDDDSIISWAFVEDDTNVYSACIVSSEPNLLTGTPPANGIENFNRGAYIDETIMYKYGTKILTASNPFISGLDPGISFSNNKLNFWAKALLQHHLANKTQGQITITGRAEIDPGYPVYIPFVNMIYWVETIEHSINFGQTFTTTLHLAYGHKPWEEITEILTQSYDAMQFTDSHLRIVRDPRSNQPTIDNSGRRKFLGIDTTNYNKKPAQHVKGTLDGTGPIINP